MTLQHKNVIITAKSLKDIKVFRSAVVEYYCHNEHYFIESTDREHIHLEKGKSHINVNIDEFLNTYRLDIFRNSRQVFSKSVLVDDKEKIVKEV